MPITYREYGKIENFYTGVSKNSVVLDYAQWKVTQLTSSQLDVNVLIDGFNLKLSYMGQFDLSGLTIPINTVEDFNTTQARGETKAVIESLLVNRNGKDESLLTASPALSFADFAGLLLTPNLPTMKGLLGGNDVFITSSTSEESRLYNLYGGNDTLYQNHPTVNYYDVFYGGDGIDTAIFPSKASNYTVVASKFVWDDSKQVGNLPGYFVTDTTKKINTLSVSEVERLQFSDKNIALDLAPTQAAGQTALLIGAVLPGKLVYDVSKQALLGSVIGLFDQNFTLAQLSGAILRLPIWDVLTNKATPTTSDIASYLVNNVYGGTQTAAITNAAIVAMNAETPSTQGNYLASLAASTANQTHVDLVGVQATGLVYLG
jgi:hypothetical protein